jgi:hypothetical protein
MIRTVGREEIRAVAAPLWLIMNGTLWPGQAGAFDIVKNGASTIVAHLAYCAVGTDEKERRNRAKVVPCRVYQDLLVSGDIDLIEILASVDFQDVEIVRTKSFVAVIIPAHERFHIGVRGTQFAYDWLINASAWKARDGNGLSFHRGFLREAQLLGAALLERLHQRYGERMSRHNSAIYLAGHSLGGAVAAILSQMRSPVPIKACYMFGTPRIAKAAHVASRYQPFATRRDLDIVPHCPPSVFGYTNFANQIASNGSPYTAAGGLELYFFASWLLSLAVKQFPNNHSMERYRLEVLDTIKQHPGVSPYWGRYGFSDILP